MKHIRSQFVFDEQGNKVAVVLDIMTFEHLLEVLEDTHLAKLTKEIIENEEEFVELDKLKQELNYKD